MKPQQTRYKYFRLHKSKQSKLHSNTNHISNKSSKKRLLLHKGFIQRLQLCYQSCLLYCNGKWSMLYRTVAQTISTSYPVWEIIDTSISFWEQNNICRHFMNISKDVFRVRKKAIKSFRHSSGK